MPVHRAAFSVVVSFLADVTARNLWVDLPSIKLPVNISVAHIGYSHFESGMGSLAWSSTGMLAVTEPTLAAMSSEQTSLLGPLPSSPLVTRTIMPSNIGDSHVTSMDMSP